MKTAIPFIKITKYLALLLLAVVLISCGNQTAEPTAASTTVVDSFDSLNLQVPDRYDPPITMNSVITTDATVKFLGDNDIYNNVWTRAYAQLLGINLDYQWVADTTMYDEKLGLSVNS
jgi:putative aldouronate transport system substrate-binding protein